MTGTPGRVRKAQQRKRDRERDPERAHAIIIAELMAIDELMSRQLIGGDDLALVAADVLWHWQAEAGQAGYRNGLRGFVRDYVTT